MWRRLLRKPPVSVPVPVSVSEEQRESLSCGDLPWVDDCLCDRRSVGHRPTGVQLARLEHLSRARARKWPFLNGKNQCKRWPPRRSGSGSPPEDSFRPPPFPNSPCNLPCFEFRPDRAIFRAKLCSPESNASYRLRVPVSRTWINFSIASSPSTSLISPINCAVSSAWVSGNRRCAAGAR